MLRLLQILLLAVAASAFDGPVNPPLPTNGGMDVPGLHHGKAVDLCGDRMAVASGDGVRIYQRTNASWRLQAEVPQGAENITCVQVSGDVLAVGFDGGVRVYEQEPVSGTWPLRATLCDPQVDATVGWTFWGNALDLDHDVLVVGGYAWAMGMGVGSASVFERRVGLTGSTWLLRDHLVDPDAPRSADQPAFFGAAVAVSGRTVAISGLSSVWTMSGDLAGRVWLYHQEVGGGRHWLRDPTPLPIYADTLAIDGDTLAAGGWMSGLTIFQRRCTGWAVQATLSLPAGSNYWPWCFSLEGGLLAVRDMGIFPTTGVAGHETVQIYERAAGAWPLRQSIPLVQAGLEFYDNHMSQLLAVDGGTIVVSEPNRDGLNGPQVGRVAVITATSAGWAISDDIAPPQPLKQAKIGTTPPLLSALAMGNDVDRVVVTASGAAILGSADEFGFVPFTLAGDGEIRARILSQTPGAPGYALNPSAKAGLMFRESLAPGARNVLVALMPSGLMFQWREFTKGVTMLRFKGAATAPVWLKLARKGTSVAGFSSLDGVTWTMLGVRPFIAGPIHAGLVVNNTATQAATVVFDGVTITPKPMPAVPTASASIDLPAASGPILATRAEE